MRRALPITNGVWLRAQQRVAGIRIRHAETPGTTYSPVFCTGLLLTVALIVSIAG